MAKFLPLVQMQMDLRKALQTAKLADYFERLCQESPGTFDALWRAHNAEPHSSLIIRRADELPPEARTNARNILAVGTLPTATTANFVSMSAILSLVQEAKSIYAQAELLLDWMREKKLDQ